MNYEEKLREIINSKYYNSEDKAVFAKYFPELKENEDERMSKEIINFLRLPHRQFVGKRDHEKWIAWLEKQKYSNIPSRETILAVWELGNDWKDLTKGVCSTEHGTQLKYIQNHWQESSYYDNIMEGGGRK